MSSDKIDKIKGDGLTEEDVRVLQHISRECPHGQPKQECLIEQTLRTGEITENMQYLSEMLTTDSRVNQLKIFLESHKACAKRRAEES
jgi:hypothetical protein